MPAVARYGSGSSLVLEVRLKDSKGGEVKWGRDGKWGGISIKGKTIRWPHGENEHYHFTVGNARPLDQAAQHATTEMLRWLQDEYNLDAPSANLLLGSYVEYDVGNFFDPAYTMVCKLPKRVLP